MTETPISDFKPDPTEPIKSPLFHMPATSAGKVGCTISILMLNCVGEILEEFGPNGEPMPAKHGFGLFWPAFVLVYADDDISKVESVRKDLIDHWEYWLK